MFPRNTSSRSVLALSLVLLVVALFGCSRSTEGDQDQTVPPAAAGTTQPPATAPGETAAQPGAPPAAAPEAKPMKPEEIPAVVARVNGEEIKKDKLLAQADQMRRQMGRMGASQPAADAALYRQVLETLVAQTLLLQEAKSGGFAVSDAEVEQRLSELRGRFPTPEDFQKALASQGMTEEKLREEVRRDGGVQKLLESKVISTVNVTEQQAKEFYDQNQEQMKQPERLRLRHILIRAGEKATAADKEKARAKADDLLERAKAGEDFAKLASENSDDPGSKGRGGELPPMTDGQTPPPFEQAAFALKKPNELSPVVETPFGYHVIQLLEHLGRVGDSLRSGEAPHDRLPQAAGGAAEAARAHVEELKTKGKVGKVSI